MVGPTAGRPVPVKVQRDQRKETAQGGADRRSACPSESSTGPTKEDGAKWGRPPVGLYR